MMNFEWEIPVKFVHSQFTFEKFIARNEFDIGYRDLHYFLINKIWICVLLRCATF